MVVSLPQINEQCIVPYVFQSVVLTLNLIGLGAVHGKFKVCKIPMPRMHLHSYNIDYGGETLLQCVKKNKRALINVRL